MTCHRDGASTRSRVACSLPPMGARASRCAPRHAAAAAARGAARGRWGSRGVRRLVAADDRATRDLAADLRAFLAPRRVRFYPSPAPATPPASPRRRTSSPPHRRPRRALGAKADAIVVASAVALAEAVPGRLAAPGRLRNRQGGARSTSAPSLRTSSPPATNAPSRSRNAASSPSRRHPRRLPGDRGPRRADRALRRRGRVDALVLDLHPAQPRRGRGGRAGARRRARRRPPRARRAGRPGGRRTKARAPPPTSASSSRWTSSARRSTSSPTTPPSSSPPPRRSSPPCATSGRTRSPR